MRRFDPTKAVLILRPADRDTYDCLLLGHNQRFIRFVPSGKSSTDRAARPTKQQRDSTPDVPDSVQLQLSLQTDILPRDLSGGWRFGSDAEKCDVILAEDKSTGISGVHFEIRINWETMAVIIFNSSGNGVSLNTSDADVDVLKQGEQCMVQHLTSRLRVGLLEFIIEHPSRGEHEEEYNENLRNYHARVEVPGLNRLKIQAPRSLPTPRLLNHRYKKTGLFIGSGGYGTVSKASDVQTGMTVAIKEFRNHVEKEKIMAEVGVLRSIEHLYIVKYLGFEEHPTPILVMEYLPEGTLADMDPEITRSETLGLFKQMISALKYLGDKLIVHRDIKDTNIVLASRTPFVSKLIDFNDASCWRKHLNTHCGTSSMCKAPEMWQYGTYSYKVDTWSLGVIITERWCEWYFGYVLRLGLPEFWQDDHLPDTQREGIVIDQDDIKATRSKAAQQRSALRWNDPEIRARWLTFVRAGLRKDERRDGTWPIISTLLLGMLQEDPDDRITTVECEEKLLESIKRGDFDDIPGFPTTLYGSVVNANPTTLAVSPFRAKHGGGSSDITEVSSPYPAILPSIEVEGREDEGRQTCFHDVHFISRERLLSATNLCASSRWRAWPVVSFTHDYPMVERDGHWFISYDNVMELARDLELSPISCHALWTLIQEATPSKSPVSIIQEASQTLQPGELIVHIWPPTSSISATQLLRLSGRTGQKVDNELKKIRIIGHRSRKPLNDTYIDYNQGLLFAHHLGISADHVKKIKKAMKKGKNGIGPKLRIQTWKRKRTESYTHTTSKRRHPQRLQGVVEEEEEVDLGEEADVDVVVEEDLHEVQLKDYLNSDLLGDFNFDAACEHWTSDLR